MKTKFFLSLFIYLLFLNCEQTKQPQLGIDVLMQNSQHLLKGKKVGVITNQTGVNALGIHVADLLFQAKGVELIALFCPEHGIRGDIEGGYDINTQTDKKTSVPIYSLYGTTRKPTSDMLQALDVLIFDIQDVGTRFYTYISTMFYAMEAAAEHQIPFWVLDRPNPIFGSIVEGWVLESGFESFVGISSIALRHGMTIGELAKLFNEQGCLANGVHAELTVIPLKNWRRTDAYSKFGVEWIKPSPNIPDVETAILYPGIGLLEATNVAEGRGTPSPFKYIGAPWLDNIQLAKQLQALNFKGVAIDTISFIPVDMPGAAVNPKYEGQRCHGLHFSITEPANFNAVSFGIHLISLIKNQHPQHFDWRSRDGIDRMAGTDKFRLAIDSGIPPDQIIESIQEDLKQFKLIREKYLLYD